MPNNLQDSLPQASPQPVAQVPQFSPAVSPQAPTPTQPAPPVPPVPVLPSSPKKKIILIIIAIVVVLIIALISVVFFLIKGDVIGKKNPADKNVSEQRQLSTTAPITPTPQSLPSEQPTYDTSYKPTADLGDSLIFDITSITQKTKDEIIAMLGDPDETGYEGSVVQYRKKGTSLTMSFDTKQRPFSISVALPYDSHTKDKEKVIKIFNLNVNDPQYRVVFTNNYNDKEYISGFTLDK